MPSGTRYSNYENTLYSQQAPFAQQVLKAIQRADVVDSTLQPKPYIGIQFVAISEFPAIGDQIGLLVEKVIKSELTINKALVDGQNIIDKQMRASDYY
jgi:sorbitol/mannitol transport system substrate-binding protein